MFKKGRGAVLVGVLLFTPFCYAGPGFFKTDGPDVPAEVAVAADAVYNFVIIASPPATFSLADSKKMLEKTPPGFIFDLVDKTIESCISQNESVCKIPYIASATAFIVGSKKDQLMTVRHNLRYDERDYKDFLKSNEGSVVSIYAGDDENVLGRNMPLHFQLYDRKGHLVFDTETKEDYARVEVLGSGEMVNFESGLHGDDPVDFALIQLSRPVGNTSLELRTSPVQRGEKLTVVGFPRSTYTRLNLDKQPDSDGKSQYYSEGDVFAPKDVLQFMFGPNYIPSPELKIENEIEKSLVYTDSETSIGLSGSPAIDSKARVAGLFVADWNVSNIRYYTPKNAISVRGDWIAKNLEKYKP